MPKKKKSKRAFKLIAFKAYYDTDEDILKWWENIDEGERSEAMRELIREQLGIQQIPRKTTLINLPELLEVHRDTLWIKDALKAMPAYLERIIQHVATHVQPNASGQTLSRASPLAVVQDEPSLTDTESERRTRRMKRATW
jgi:hypothetical protein